MRTQLTSDSIILSLGKMIEQKEAFTARLFPLQKSLSVSLPLSLSQTCTLLWLDEGNYWVRVVFTSPAPDEGWHIFLSLCGGIKIPFLCSFSESHVCFSHGKELCMRSDRVHRARLDYFQPRWNGITLTVTIYPLGYCLVWFPNRDVFRL